MIYSFDIVFLLIILSRTDNEQSEGRRKTDAFVIIDVPNIDVESAWYSSFNNCFVNWRAIVKFDRVSVFFEIFFVRKLLNQEKNQQW